jgi:hypothetical protein
MSDELKPALNAGQWRVLGFAEEWRLDGADLRNMREPAIVANVAMANAALREGSPYKITRRDLDAIGLAAEIVASDGMDDRPILALADKLAALLPPEVP